MWPDLLDQQPVSIMDLGQRRIGRGGSQGVRNAAQLLDTSPDTLVLTLEAAGERGVPRGQAAGAVRARAQRAQGVEDHRSVYSFLQQRARPVSYTHLTLPT